jgi:SAM-dependent methyltransferase
MTTAQAGFGGVAPEVRVGPGNPEAEKYGKLWALPEYRKVAPGEATAQDFLRQARPRPGAEVIDFGCGTGRGALMLALLGGLKVTMVDFVRNCLDPELEEALTTQAHALTFVKADLERPLPMVAEYGFCSDVMEHIPPDRVDTVLDNILKAAQHVFFSISTTEDSCGTLIGEPLHLTVQPFGWWLQRLAAHDCVVHWSHRGEAWAQFYVSAWSTGRDVVKTGVLNVDTETFRTNVAHNIAQGWQQVHPHDTNDLDCMIVGGGPSLAAFEDEIKQRRADGVKLITLNGAYNWALEHGLTPVQCAVHEAGRRRLPLSHRLAVRPERAGGPAEGSDLSLSRDVVAERGPPHHAIRSGVAYDPGGLDGPSARDSAPPHARLSAVPSLRVRFEPR